MVSITTRFWVFDKKIAQETGLRGLLASVPNNLHTRPHLINPKAKAEVPGAQ